MVLTPFNGLYIVSCLLFLFCFRQITQTIFFTLLSRFRSWLNWNWPFIQYIILQNFHRLMTVDCFIFLFGIFWFSLRTIKINFKMKNVGSISWLTCKIFVSKTPCSCLWPVSVQINVNGISQRMCFLCVCVCVCFFLWYSNFVFKFPYKFICIYCFAYVNEYHECSVSFYLIIWFKFVFSAVSSLCVVILDFQLCKLFVFIFSCIFCKSLSFWKTFTQFCFFVSIYWIIAICFMNA